MADRTVLEYGIYLGVENGKSHFRLLNDDRTVVYKQSVAKRFKTGTKVVLTTQHISKKSPNRAVLRVHGPESVISGTGTVTCIGSDFGYIGIEQPNRSSVVFFKRNVDHPTNSLDCLLSMLLPRGASVKFEAIQQVYNAKSEYRAVRVITLEDHGNVSPAPEFSKSLPRTLQAQRGIIVNISPNGSLFIWSKELGLVYASNAHLVERDGKQTHEGQWLEFDVREQDLADKCHWEVLESHLVDDQLKCVFPKGLRQYSTYFQLVDCIGIVTNVFGGYGLLWSPQLGKVFICKNTTKGWDPVAFKDGKLVNFNAQRILRAIYEDIGWQATSIKVTSIPQPSYSIKRCIAHLVDIPEPRCGALYNEQYGRISFTWMDFHVFTTGDKEFRAAVNQYKCFDVRFVAALVGWNAKWCALHVQPAEAEVKQQAPLQDQSKGTRVENANDVSFVVIDEATANAFAEELDNELDEFLQSNQDLNHTSGIESDACTSLLVLQEPQLQDSVCQTEPLPELTLFQLICDTPSLLSVMTKNHKNYTLVMRQLVRNKFIPNYLGAKVQCESASSPMQRNVSCQTAASPESRLANRLINDQEIFSLVMDIDQNLLMSIP